MMAQWLRAVSTTSLFVVSGLSWFVVQVQPSVVTEAAETEIKVPPYQSPFGTLLPVSPSEPGNAADEYIQTIRALSRRLDAIGVHDEKDYSKGLPLTPDELQGIVKGSKKKDSAFAPTYYPVKRSGLDPELNIAAIRTIDNGILEQGHKLEGQGKLDEATHLYESLVTFGWHLKQEKRSLVQHMLGIVTESLGCEALQQLSTRRGLEEQARIYGAYRDKEQARLKLIAKKHRLIQEDKEFASRVLQQDEDPMWRREAVDFVATHLKAKSAATTHAEEEKKP